VAELNRQRADQVRASGCRVIGDPAALAAPAEVADLGPLPEDVSLTLAAVSVAGVVDAVRRRETRGRSVRTRRVPSAPTGGLDRAASRELARELARRVRRRLRGRLGAAR
jgi:hypothetical protein